MVLATPPAGGHRSVIMSVQQGKVLTLLVKLMRGGREKVCIVFQFFVLPEFYYTITLMDINSHLSYHRFSVKLVWPFVT